MIQLLIMTDLISPKSWKDATESDRAKASNGCGPQSAFFSAIPKWMRNFLFGLDISCACDIHDWMYEHGTSSLDKFSADEAFYQNMARIIRAKGGPLMSPRLFIAWLYYEAVSHWGGESFEGDNATD